MDVSTVTIGPIYMYRLVFTAPSTFTPKFQVTKQRADAPSPRYSRLKMQTVWAKSEGCIEISKNGARIIMKNNP